MDCGDCPLPAPHDYTFAVVLKLAQAKLAKLTQAKLTRTKARDLLFDDSAQCIGSWPCRPADEVLGQVQVDDVEQQGSFVRVSGTIHECRLAGEDILHHITVTLMGDMEKEEKAHDEAPGEFVSLVLTRDSEDETMGACHKGKQTKKVQTNKPSKKFFCEMLVMATRGCSFRFDAKAEGDYEETVKKPFSELPIKAKAKVVDLLFANRDQLEMYLHVHGQLEGVSLRVDSFEVCEFAERPRVRLAGSYLGLGNRTATEMAQFVAAIFQQWMSSGDLQVSLAKLEFDF
jgi:hypothetical protein